MEWVALLGRGPLAVVLLGLLVVVVGVGGAAAGLPLEVVVAGRHVRYGEVRPLCSGLRSSSSDSLAEEEEDEDEDEEELLSSSIFADHRSSLKVRPFLPAAFPTPLDEVCPKAFSSSATPCIAALSSK